MAKFNRHICENCHAVFVKEKEEQRFCSYLCESRFNGDYCLGEPLKSWKCAACDRIFNLPYERSWCGERCRAALKSNQPVSTEARCASQNRLWLEDNQIQHQHKKNKRRISYEELERRSEYNRVYGKGAWDHYEKGRKWDRI